MFIIQISGIDSSCHTQECDANEQKARFIENGADESSIQIVEKDVFNPPQAN